jgi:uncharacterized membrane protein
MNDWIHGGRLAGAMRRTQPRYGARGQFPMPLRSNLWLVPWLMVAAALVVFVVTQSLDRAQHAGAIHLPGWLDQGGAADARSLLAATAGAIITTLGLVLSVTVLTLSIAASQFGQRLLRRYMCDIGTQLCIGTFAATFVFSLLTLMSVTSRADEKEYVPWLSVWISTLWAISCIGVLIYYISHVAVIIQVNTLVADIAADFHRAVRANHSPSERSMPPIPEVSPDRTLVAPIAGYIQWIDYPRLVLAAVEADGIVRFLCRPGQFVVKGAVMAVAECRRLPGGKLQEMFAGAVKIGKRRIVRQDSEFAISQIVEIALRAMSPGMNDPTTALTCVDWLGDSIRALAGYPRRNPAHVDQRGKVRVVEKVNEFERVVAAAFDPIRQVARNSAMLTIRLLNTFFSIAPFMETTSQREALYNQVELAFEGFSAEAVSGDRADVSAAYYRAIRALRLAWSPAGRTG